MPIQVVLADDHGVLRAGLKALLEAHPDIDVVGEASTTDEAFNEIIRTQPDIALVDIGMPGEGGIALTRRVVESGIDTRVLILTLHEDVTLMKAALSAGAKGYIVKRAVDSELLDAIRAVDCGQIYVHPLMTSALLEFMDVPIGGTSNCQEPVESLTPREEKILGLIAEGYTNREIAEILDISVRTVETHRANLCDKLGTNSRVELVRYAREHGLIT